MSLRAVRTVAAVTVRDLERFRDAKSSTASHTLSGAEDDSMVTGLPSGLPYQRSSGR